MPCRPILMDGMLVLFVLMLYMLSQNVKDYSSFFSPSAFV